MKHRIIIVIIFFPFLLLSQNKKSGSVENVFLDCLYVPSGVDGKILIDEDDSILVDDKIYFDGIGEFWMINDSIIFSVNFSGDTSVIADLYKLPETLRNSNDLLWLRPGLVIAVDDNVVKVINGDKTGDFFLLPYKFMNISMASDNSFYMYGKTDSNIASYELYLYDLRYGSTKICEFSDRINAVCGNGIMTIVAVKGKIYAMDYVTGPHLLYSGDEDVLSIAVTFEGNMFFSTKNAIYYCKGFEKISSFSTIGASKMWCCDDKLYILLSNNMLIRLDTVSMFDLL